MKDLAEPKYLSLKEVFESEASDFTPWLSENLDRLADQLGFELQHEDTEVNVGKFKADIKARTTDSHTVVIENQFDRTDHPHLGQLLTYAAGLKAKVVIWIAEHVRDEHRAAIDWLNEMASDADFFAVEARAITIDNSRPALLWDVVSSPNTWSRITGPVVGPSQPGPMDQLRKEYWAGLNQLIEERGVKLTRYKPAKDAWQGGSIGKNGFLLLSGMSISKKQVWVDIYLDGDKAGDWYQKLFARKAKIEETLGYELSWRPLEEKRACRIGVSLEADPGDRNDWENQLNWIIDKRIELEGVFRPLIPEITVD